MKKLSLKWRLFLVGAMPFLCFLGVISYLIHNNYYEYKESVKLTSKMELIEAASAVVHESQKERGKSASYLNGGTNLVDVEGQRKVNDQKIEKLRAVVSSSVFPKSYNNEIISELDNLLILRDKVSAKSIPLGQALKGYSSMIARFLKIQTDTAERTGLALISAKLRAFRILEDAKESGGKLRANMSAILAKNGPITDKKFAAIVSLKAGVDEGLKSSGLVLDKKSKNYIKEFKDSKEWGTVNKTFQLILKNADNGGYYQDSKQFFAIITTALNILGELIIYKKDELKSNVGEIRGEAIGSLWKISLFSFILFLAAFAFVVITAKTTSQGILNVVRKLSKSSDEVEESSHSIASTSSQLSEAATEQASSLQETVSSIDEISSMVQRNSDAAGSSTQVSTKSTEVASHGKEKVEQMISSIGEISDSNNKIMVEMQNNNEEISKIINVISQIGEKTKVINDIVFQTKLLSFNASVEAARAGEHGKGFAVVAEEVGNLASMSGKAALEISEMLDSSIKQVTEIVESSKGKIESLVQIGKEKVELGTKTATDCGEVIDEIMQNVSSVNEMVKEIASASTEQSTGVQEVTKAMQQLDQVTHQNTSSAQESSVMAKTLNGQAVRLSDAVAELTALVNGKSGNVPEFSDSPGKSEKSTETSQNDNVVSLSKRTKEAQSSSSELKVSGLDTSIPSENDPRFEDL